MRMSLPVAQCGHPSPTSGVRCDPCEIAYWKTRYLDARVNGYAEGLNDAHAYDNNSTVDDRERRKDLSCSHCPPNHKENATRRGRHGKTKPKYKTKKR